MTMMRGVDQGAGTAEMTGRAPTDPATGHRSSGLSLIERVQNAYGGLEPWRRLETFSAHITLSGSALPPPEGRRPPGGSQVTVGSYSFPTITPSKPTLRELVVEGKTATPRVRIFGPHDMAIYADYTPERVEFRDMDDNLLHALEDPVAALRERDQTTPFNQQERGFIFGALIWEAIAGPFLLNHPDAKIIETALAGNETSLDAITVEWPRRLAPLAPKRTFHLSRSGYIARSEYDLGEIGLGRVVDLVSAPVSFGDITVSTLRRLRSLDEAGGAISPPLIDLEIFDVQFS